LKNCFKLYNKIWIPYIVQKVILPFDMNRCFLSKIVKTKLICFVFLLVLRIKPKQIVSCVRLCNEGCCFYRIDLRLSLDPRLDLIRTYWSNNIPFGVDLAEEEYEKDTTADANCVWSSWSCFFCFTRNPQLTWLSCQTPKSSLCPLHIILIVLPYRLVPLSFSPPSSLSPSSL